MDLHAGSQKEYLTREDSSQAAVFVSTPDNQETFPMVVYVDGSLKQSVKNNFAYMALLFGSKNIGLAAVEKRGIDEGVMDEREWLEHDCYEERLQDHILLINELKNTIPNWNGKLILIGSSEGGKIAPKLSVMFPEVTYGTVLIGSGGGMAFGDEIKYQINQIMLEEGEDGMNDEIENEFAEMLSDPESLKVFFGKTYKWFSSYLQYDLMAELLKIETPLLMIHGVKDANIPVESADLVNMHFEFSEKSNLEYLRFDDLGHSISKRIDIFFAILEWSDLQLAQEEQLQVAMNE
jgi:esterase/lipase